MSKLSWVMMALIVTSCTPKNDKRTVSDANSSHTGDLLKTAEEFYRHDNYVETINVLDKLLMLDSTIGEAYFMRAYCEGQLNMENKAIKNYQKAIKYGYRIEDSYFNMGNDYAILGIDSLAIVCFEKALEINPYSVDAQVEIDNLQKKR